MNPELSMGIIAYKAKLNGLVSDQLQTLSCAT
jgi:hypothetical protein